MLEADFAEMRSPGLYAWATTLSRKDVAGIAFAAVLLVVIALTLVVLPNFPRWAAAIKQMNEGFGPEWQCEDVTTPNGGTPICFKKTKLDDRGEPQTSH